MKKAFLFAVLLLFPACIQAQTADDAKQKAALRFLEASGTKTNLERTIHVMIKMQIDQNPQLEPYRDLMSAFLEKYLSWDALKDDLVKIYEESFTADELNQLADFYETPLGKKVSVKLAELTMRGSMIGQKNVQDHMAEFQDSIQKRKSELDEKEAAKGSDKKPDAAPASEKK